MNNSLFFNKTINSKEIIIKDYVERFLNYIDVEQKTRDTYKIALKQFCGYLISKGINTPTRDEIIEYREFLKENHKPTTVNSYLIAIRNLYNYLEYEGIAKDITKNIKGIKIGNEHKKNALTNEQCKEILKNAKDIKERIMFLLATTCGLRVNEIRNIRLQDFKQINDKICLYVLGKDRDYKQDYVIVSNEVFEEIKQYVDKYEIVDYLFTSNSNHNKGNVVTTKTIRFTIKNMFKRAGIDGSEYSPHSCRHYFATNSIKNGIDIREVSQALRHKNINTSLIYLHDLEKLENKCSNIVANDLLGGY